jgi:hypothetical protein
MIDPSAEDNLRIYPADLWRFGKTPYNRTLYRIVWAPNRRFVARDDSGRFTSYRMYGSLGDVWVMEKWLSPWDFAKCGPDQWNRTLSKLGPYPTYGEYQHVHTFNGSPADANLDKLIKWLNEKRSPAENRRAIREAYDAETVSANKNVADAVGERLPAYGVRPFVGARVKRGSKTAAEIRLRARQSQHLGPNKMRNTLPAIPPRVTLER